MKKVLTIAGSDSGGGAGIQADIKTISALGCYASSAITAVTVQNTLGVSGVHVVPTDIVEAQIDAVLSDIGADAVKIGMLFSADIVRAVARQLKAHEITSAVLDPVMVSTSGHTLFQSEAVTTLISDLIPLSRIITPNVPEAEVLLGGAKITEGSQLPEAAKELSQRFGVSVLLKAGHIEADTLVDILYCAEDRQLYELPALRVDTPNTHGTGCTMSSAIAAFLAKGFTLPEAVKGAKDYVNNAIISGANYSIGHGHGPVNHFYHLPNNSPQILLSQ